MIGITRRITRRSDARIRSGGKDRHIILELSPGGDGTPGAGFLGFRLERTRKVYYLPVAFCYLEAMKAEVAARQAERKKKRAV